MIGGDGEAHGMATAMVIDGVFENGETEMRSQKVSVVIDGNGAWCGKQRRDIGKKEKGQIKGKGKGAEKRIKIIWWGDEQKW